MPTPAGDSYYRHCIELLNTYAKATSAAQRHGSGLAGNIVVGLMPTMTRCVLAPALARFIETHPNVVVRVVEGYSATLTEQVQAAELEFAVVPAFSGAPGLKSRLFLRTPEVLVSGSDQRAAHLEPVRLADLAPLKLVVPSKANTRRRLIETYLASNGVAIERTARAGRHARHARFRRAHRLDGDPARHHDGRRSPRSRQFTVNPIADAAVQPRPRPDRAVAAADVGERPGLPGRCSQEESMRLNRRWDVGNGLMRCSF